MNKLIWIGWATTAACAGFALYVKDEQIKAQNIALDDLKKLCMILIKHMDENDPVLDAELAEFQAFIEIRNNIDLTADEGV